MKNLKFIFLATILTGSLSWAATSDKDLFNLASKGTVEQVEQALKEGLKIDAQDEVLGETALMKALQDKNFAVAKFLIEAGADVNVVSTANKQTALMFAVSGDYELVQMLIDKGAKVKVKNGFEATPFGLAASFGKEPKILKLLLDNGADINEQDSIGQTPLMSAVSWGNIDMVAELINLGADTQIKDKEGKTALDWAKAKIKALEPQDRHDMQHIIAFLEEKEPKPEAKAKINLDPYKNERYGFSFSLAPSNWVATESDNGDGITVKDDNTEVRVYGTRAYAVLGQSLKEAMDELSKDLTSFSRMELDDSKGLFTIEGKNKEGGLIYIRCFFKEDYAIVAHIITANGNEESFNMAAAVIEASFK